MLTLCCQVTVPPVWMSSMLGSSSIPHPLQGPPTGYREQRPMSKHAQNRLLKSLPAYNSLICNQQLQT